MAELALTTEVLARLQAIYTDWGVFYVDPVTQLCVVLLTEGGGEDGHVVGNHVELGHSLDRAKGYLQGLAAAWDSYENGQWPTVSVNIENWLNTVEFQPTEGKESD